MPIEVTENVAWAVFGTGDVVFCSCAEKTGDRQYLAFQSCEPGKIGYEDDVGREVQIKDGWVPGSGGPCIALEFANVESLDQVIAALQDHRAAKFPDAPLLETAAKANAWDHVAAFVENEPSSQYTEVDLEIVKLIESMKSGT